MWLFFVCLFLYWDDIYLIDFFFLQESSQDGYASLSCRDYQDPRSTSQVNTRNDVDCRSSYTIDMGHTGYILGEHEMMQAIKEGGPIVSIMRVPQGLLKISSRTFFSELFI